MSGARALYIAVLCATFAVAPDSVLAQKADAPVNEGDGISLFDPRDSTMNAAIAEAQRTLPLFLDHVLDDEGLSADGALKVSFETFPENVGNEIIWVTAFQEQPDGRFTGILNNEPVNLGNWTIGTYVTFERDAIQDWSLPSEHGMWGNFTTRVIAQLPENEYLWEYLAAEPVPAEWRLRGTD